MWCGVVEESVSSFGSIECHYLQNPTIMIEFLSLLNVNSVHPFVGFFLVDLHYGFCYINVHWSTMQAMYVSDYLYS